MKILKCVLLIFFLVSLSVGSWAQSEAIFDIVDVETLNLDEAKNEKVEKVKNNQKIKLTKGLKFKDFAKVARDSDRKLLLPIPGVGKVLLSATDMNFINDDNFIWEGSFTNYGGFARFNCDDGCLSGFIDFEGRYFQIVQLKKNKHILMEYDWFLMSTLAADIPPPEENPDDPPSGGGGGSGSVSTVVRLLVLYTSAADQANPDIIQTASTAAGTLNSILNASVPDKDIYIHHVATLPYSFTETSLLAEVDLDAIMIDPIANSLRSLKNADLVVVLTDGDYEFNGADVFGWAGTLTPLKSKSYALVDHDAANTGYTFSHEVGHLFGGRHQDDPWATHDKGHGNVLLNWGTVMHTTYPYFNRIPRFSNPDISYNWKVTGVANSNDVARRIEETVDSIANYYSEDDLYVSISGPTSGNSSTAYTWNANVTGGLAPYLYAWEVSYNGVDYVAYLGSSQSLTWTFPPNCTSPFTLRVRVQSPDIQTAYGFITFYPDQLGPESSSGLEEIDNLKISSIEATNLNDTDLKESNSLSIYPNPITDASLVSFCLEFNSHVELAIIDIRGKKVMTILSEAFISGSHSRSLDLSNLSNGIYYVSLKSQNHNIQKKIILMNY